jgi:hypothetical protein
MTAQSRRPSRIRTGRPRTAISGGLPAGGVSSSTVIPAFVGTLRMTSTGQVRKSA